MSDSTSPIDRASLQHGLAQILRCYSAGGLKRFNRTTSVEIPAELLPSTVEQPQHVVASATTAASEGRDRRLNSVPSAVSPGTSPVPTSPEPVINGETVASPAPAASTSLAASEPQLMQWQFPSMENDARLANLAALDTQVQACRKCEELVCYRRQTVFGDGHIRPKVCFVGEAPGADEDAQGKPFVGAAGRLLNDIIRAMRMSREEVYILNALKCRPPQNRTPVLEEINNCRPYALTQLEILQPDFIILLGAVAVRSVLQTEQPVGRLRGRFHHFHGARVVVTYHPAYLLRTPEAKKLVWSDVQMVMRELKLI